MKTDREPRILIVDDEPIVRAVLSRRLNREGSRCLEAFDVPSALALLKSMQFELVLTDIRMPGKSGVELLTDIKQKWPKTWVIMETGTFDLDTAINCMKIGAADYITKPFELNSFVQSVRRTLQKRAEQVEKIL